MSKGRDSEPRWCRRWHRKRAEWVWKARYETRAEAVAAESNGQQVYVCPECTFWHRASVHKRREVAQ